MLGGAENLKSKTIGNLSASAVAVLSVNVAQFFTSIILARMLVASDYGIVGFSQILINFMMQFSDFGLNSALIQKKEVSEETLYSGLSLKILLSLIATASIWLCSLYFVAFTDRKQIGIAVAALSLNFIFSIFSFLPQVVLTRELKYKKLVLPQTLGVIVGASTSIGMASWGCGYWSLVVGNLVNNLFNAVLLNVVRPVSYRWFFNRDVAKDLATFGWNMVLPGIIIFIIMNVDNFMIGTFRGAMALGFYTIAFNWSTMICTVLSGVVHRVLFPTFSQFQHDVGRIKEWYLQSVKYIALIAIPVNIGLLLVGREFLVLVLGKGEERWLPSLPVLKVLCVYGIARALLEPVGNVLSALGKPHHFVRANVIAAVTEVAGISLALFIGADVLWVAVAVLVAYLTQYAIYYRIMKIEVSLRVGEVLENLAWAGVAAVSMAAGLLLLKAHVGFSVSGMIVQIVFGAVLYILTFGFCDRWRVFSELTALVRTGGR